MIGDPGSPLGALGGLALVFALVVFASYVPTLARRVRSAWRDLNRPLR